MVFYRWCLYGQKTELGPDLLFSDDRCSRLSLPGLAYYRIPGLIRNQEKFRLSTGWPPHVAFRPEPSFVPGIGHKIKSRNNPDLRVELVKEFVIKRFPDHKLLDYALAVETVTTSKEDDLILNVDGCVAVCFVDL